MKELEKIEGFVRFNDFCINADDPANENPFNLKQDLLQVELAEDCLLDVGWYPDFDPKGEFQIRVVENSDWENLIYYNNTKKYDDLINFIGDAINTFGSKKIIDAWTKE